MRHFGEIINDIYWTAFLYLQKLILKGPVGQDGQMFDREKDMRSINRLTTDEQLLNTSWSL